MLWKADLDANLQVCPKCGRHFRLDARSRVESLLEPGFELVDLELKSTDPLNFVDLKPYKARLRKAQDETGLNDAILTAIGFLNDHAVVLTVLEYAFIGGTMGAVVGETIARAIERSLSTRHPLIIVAASGGARMQEGIVSLMQLAKVSSGLALLDDAKIPYLSVLTDPTTGGVSASFGMLGDLNIAEPGALIGFAGPRVIELDAVVDRRELKAYLSRALDFMGRSAGHTAQSAKG